MGSGLRTTFVVAVNSREVLEQNLLASPCLQDNAGHQFLIQENYKSAAAAYNDALEKASNNVIIFLHQDLFLPSGWLSQLEENLRYLEETDPAWGVLGCWGARADGQLCGHIYSSGLGILGAEFGQPVPIRTLDEIVLIFRKDSGLRFDEALPHFHFYGTDICMRAAEHGRRCYVVSAFCIHNTQQLLTLPKEFYACYKHMKQVWNSRLPIKTTCIEISRFDEDMLRRRAKQLCRRVLQRKLPPASPRVPDPERILQILGNDSPPAF